MPEHTLAITVDRLHVPRWVAPAEYQTILALTLDECDGGDGEFDAPGDTILRWMFNRNTIKEWEAHSVRANATHVVFEGVRVVFTHTPPIKRCFECQRVMTKHECGDVFDEERVCDQCVEARAKARLAEHLVRYLTRRAERTGLLWWVVERYETRGFDHGGSPSGSYHRALITNGFGTQVRIYYSTHKQCWRRS